MGDHIESQALEGFNNYQYFGTVGRSFLTLFFLLTLSEWSTVSRPLLEHDPLAMLVITVFILVAVFGILNIVVGVLVERALEAAEKFAKQGRDAEMAQRMLMVDEFEKLMVELDADGSGQLSQDEFIQALDESLSFKLLLQKLDFPTAFTIGEMFTLMDESGDGTIDVHEFTIGIVRLMESTPFQQFCLLVKSLNHSKSLNQVFSHEKAHEEPTEAPATTDLSDFSKLKCKEGAFPDCLKKDIAVLRLELQEMKALFSSKLNKMVWVSCPDETQLHRLLASGEQMPIWIPLPIAGDQSDRLVCGRCAPLGGDPTEFGKNAKQPGSAAASIIGAIECGTNCPVNSTTFEQMII